MAEIDSTHHHTSSHLRKRRKKSRYIKQGYHKSERDDSRRVTARSFLSGITRDGHLQNRGQVAAQDEGSTGNLFITTGLSRKLSIKATGSIDRELSPPSTPVLEARYFSPTSKLLHDVSLESPKRTPTKHVLLAGTKSLDHSTESYLSGPRSSTNLHTEQPELFSKLPPTTDGALYINELPSPYYYETARSGRVVLTTSTGTLLSVYSVLPYNKYMRLRQENPKREGMRARTSSFSLQIDLDGIELGTQEVSLAFLLDPLWIPSEHPQPASDQDTPFLLRRQSTRRGEASSDKRSSTPTSQARYHINPEVLSMDSRDSFPGQLYRDHHSPAYILLNYHPLCVDNEEYFVGRKTTTLTPLGYRVSIIEYAKKSDIKKGLNERFKDVYPYIELPLTKLRKVKRKIYEISMECNLDLVATSYAYVYYEKLVLMGKIHRSIRWTVAGVCLLLAAKFTLDLKKQDITNLINEITDRFPVSSRELLLYEFPVLASLQFSLLTPTFQVKPHLDRLQEGSTPLSAGH